MMIPGIGRSLAQAEPIHRSRASFWSSRSLADTSSPTFTFVLKLMPSAFMKSTRRCTTYKQHHIETTAPHRHSTTLRQQHHTETAPHRDSTTLRQHHMETAAPHWDSTTLRQQHHTEAAPHWDNSTTQRQYHIETAAPHRGSTTLRQQHYTETAPHWDNSTTLRQQHHTETAPHCYKKFCYILCFNSVYFFRINVESVIERNKVCRQRC